MTSEHTLKKKWNNILILGRGYIGSYLNAHLSSNNVVFFKSSDELNYHDKRTLNKFILNNNIDVIINCSGFTGKPNVDEGELKKELCWNLNVFSPLTINKICNNLGVRYIHVSSGCIYNGYSQVFKEEDKPNFGLFDDSSFYSKSKHAFELMSKDLLNEIIRIRMPISPDVNSRNYLTKIRNYNNIIDLINSKTYIPDLCKFIENLLYKSYLELQGLSFKKSNQQIYNVVNPSPLSTKEIVEEMKNIGWVNDEWNIIPIEELQTIAPRSNCVLCGEKANSIYEMRPEIDIIKESLKIIKKSL
jgi:dTDP-4-dehydrorhamnose reductase